MLVFSRLCYFLFELDLDPHALHLLISVDVEN